MLLARRGESTLCRTKPIDQSGYELCRPGEGVWARLTSPGPELSDVATEVRGLDRLVAGELLAGPRPDDLPGLQDVRSVGALEGLGSVLLHEQDRRTLL